MKKLLFGGLLALAAIGFISAQESEGLKISGSIQTGLRFDVVGGNEEWGQPAKNDDTGKIDPTKPTDKIVPSFGVWHDDAGNRLTLAALYNKDNYGLKFSTEIGFAQFGDWNNPTFNFTNVYGWFDVMNGMLRFTVGKIDDGVWGTGGIEDFDFGKGIGLRFEAKPIEGLNVGLFLRPAQAFGDYWGSQLNRWNWDPENPTLVNNRFLHPNVKGPISSRFVDALLETSIGAKYQNDMFVASLGFKLASEASGPSNLDWSYGLGVLNFDEADIGMNIHEGDPKKAYDDMKGVGFNLYLGFGLNMIENLTAVFAVRLQNLGAFDSYGNVWIWQQLGYRMGDMSFGLDAQQRILTANKENNYAFFNKDGEPANAYLLFMPWFRYQVNPKARVGIDIRPIFQPASYINVDLRIRPRFWYDFGSNFGLEAYYALNITAFNGDNPYGGKKDNGDTRDTLFRNVVQLNLIWRF